ncbi:MAG: MGMT family protein [Elusimicrobia bacterium]|nr:MGMT family protein [Elusimicrobiota bacterium]
MKIPRRVLKAMGKYPVFYRQVWKACAAIAPGRTRSYGWLARKIGRPGAARAVGRALAANPFAPLVPCHRVIRADGGLGGYSGPGGQAAKLRRLQAEKKRAQR